MTREHPRDAALTAAARDVTQALMAATSTHGLSGDEFIAALAIVAGTAIGGSFPGADEYQARAHLLGRLSCLTREATENTANGVRSGASS